MSAACFILARVWVCFMLEREKEQWKELRVRVCFMLARAHTTSSPVRGRKRKRERERERGREREM